MNRRVSSLFLSFVFFMILLPTNSHSSWPDSWWPSKNDRLCSIEAPSWQEELNTYPVEVVIDLANEARPETFRAWLNKTQVTHKFEQVDGSMRAMVSPEDGLTIRVKDKPWTAFNMVNHLVVKIQGGACQESCHLIVFYAACNMTAALSDDFSGLSQTIL